MKELMNKYRDLVFYPTNIGAAASVSALVALPVVMSSTGDSVGGNVLWLICLLVLFVEAYTVINWLDNLIGKND